MSDKTKQRTLSILEKTAAIRKKYEKRNNTLLSLFSAVLIANLFVLLDEVASPGIAVVSSYGGSVLLHNDAGAYVIVGILSFILGTVFTLVCIRLKNHRSKKHGE